MTAVSAGLQVGFATAETPGDLFRKQMSQLKARCAKGARTPGDITCDMLTLKLEDPLGTAEGRLAHSIKIPATVPERTYRPGMSSDAYFQGLCQEAGEFIFTVVTGVDGVMQLRPRSIATGQMLRHLYALEDPYGYREWEARQPEAFYVNPESYRFLERPVDPARLSGQVVRYHGYDGRDRKTMKKDVASAPESRFGFLWRGINRPNDRELGIAGGELIVLELATFKVLGVKRGFARALDGEPYSQGIWWRSPTVCPGDKADLFAQGNFVAKVLRPTQR